MAQKHKIGNTEITFELIEPLVIHTEVEGTKVFVEFRIPGTDEVIESDSTMKRGKDTKSKVKQQVKRQVARGAQRAATRMMRQALGGGMVARTANMAMRTGSRDMIKQSEFGNAEKEEAIVAAFIRVQNHFHYDEETGNNIFVRE